MKPIIAIFLSVLLVFGAFSGCEKVEGPKEPTMGGFFETNPTEKPDQETETAREISLVYNPDAPINPFQCTDNTNRVLFSLMYQGLFAVDQNYQAYPILCDTYNISADMKTYTFYLADALFSDGTGITANDTAKDLYIEYSAAFYKYDVEEALKRIDHYIRSEMFDEAVIEILQVRERFPHLFESGKRSQPQYNLT